MIYLNYKLYILFILLMEKRIDKIINNVVGYGLTNKQKFNKKYGFNKNESHSLNEISKITKYKKKGLETIFNKGVGAYHTNPESVRPQVHSPEQWAMARVYASINPSSKASKVDKSHLISGGKINFHKIHWGAFTKQFNNRKNKRLKNFKEFSNYILKHPNEFNKITKKRANFYKNFIFGRGINGGKLIEKTKLTRDEKWYKKNINPDIIFYEDDGLADDLVPEIIQPMEGIESNTTEIKNDNVIESVDIDNKNEKVILPETGEIKNEINSVISDVLSEVEKKEMDKERQKELRKLIKEHNDSLSKDVKESINIDLSKPNIISEIEEDRKFNIDEPYIDDNLDFYIDDIPEIFYGTEIPDFEILTPEFIDNEIKTEKMENLNLFIENPYVATEYYRGVFGDKFTEEEIYQAVRKEGKTTEYDCCGNDNPAICEIMNVEKCNPQVADFFIDDVFDKSKEILLSEGFDEDEINQLKSQSYGFGIDLKDDILKSFMEIKQYTDKNFISKYNKTIERMNEIKNDINDDNFEVLHPDKVDYYNKYYKSGKLSFKDFFYKTFPEFTETESIQLAKFPKPNYSELKKEGLNLGTNKKELKEAIEKFGPLYDIKYKNGYIKGLEYPEKKDESKLQSRFRQIINEEFKKSFTSKYDAKVIYFTKQCPFLFDITKQLQKHKNLLSIYQLGVMDQGESKAILLPITEMKIPKIKKDITNLKYPERLDLQKNIYYDKEVFNKKRSEKKMKDIENEVNEIQEKIDKLLEKEKMGKKSDKFNSDYYIEKRDKLLEEYTKEQTPQGFYSGKAFRAKGDLADTYKKIVEHQKLSSSYQDTSLQDLQAEILLKKTIPKYNKIQEEINSLYNNYKKALEKEQNWTKDMKDEFGKKITKTKLGQIKNDLKQIYDDYKESSSEKFDKYSNIIKENNILRNKLKTKQKKLTSSNKNKKILSNEI